MNYLQINVGMMSVVLFQEPNENRTEVNGRRVDEKVDVAVG